MDGLALTFECTFEIMEHDGMYSICHGDTIVNNIFVLGLEGKAFLCKVTCSSSWHNESITAAFLSYIHNKIGNYKMCVDQGIPRSSNDSLILVGLMSRRQARKPWISNMILLSNRQVSGNEISSTYISKLQELASS